MSRGCLPDGCEGGGVGKGRGAGGALVSPRGKVAMSCDKVLTPGASFAVQVSSLSNA